MQRLNNLDLFFRKHNFTNILDQNKDLIGFNNGVYDLITGDFRFSVPSDYISLSTGYNYEYIPKDNPVRREVECLIDAILPIPDVRKFTMLTLASTLDGYIRDEYFYIWCGKRGAGGGGKSTLTELHKMALGDYGAITPVSLMTKGRENASSANSALMAIRNKRFIEMQEPDVRDTLQAGILKSLTGGDDITTRELHSTQITFKPHAKFFLCCNKLPNISDIDGGVTRRLHIIEFVSRFVDDPKPTPDDPYIFKRNNNLKSKFASYKMAYMSILLDYYKVYRKEGLKAPHSVTKLTKKYEDNNNQIKQFVTETLVYSKRSVLKKSQFKEIFQNDRTLVHGFRKFQHFVSQLEMALGTDFEQNKNGEVIIKGWALKPTETIDESGDACDLDLESDTDM